MKKLQASCHCQTVQFSLDTDWPYPFMWCSCRKTAGSPVIPFVKGKQANLEITSGEEDTKAYRERTNERHFCTRCGSALYLLDSRWPEDCWVQASAVDTTLPVCPEHVHIFVKYKAPWFPIHTAGAQYDEYPDFSIEDWHQKTRLL